MQTVATRPSQLCSDGGAVLSTVHAGTQAQQARYRLFKGPRASKKAIWFFADGHNAESCSLV